MLSLEIHNFSFITISDKAYSIVNLENEWLSFIVAGSFQAFAVIEMFQLQSVLTTDNSAVLLYNS